MKASIIHSAIRGAALQALAARGAFNVGMDAASVSGAFRDLHTLGIHISPEFVADQMRALKIGGSAIGMDDLLPLNPLAGSMTAPSTGVPVQFLQSWLPGLVRVITAVRNADAILGISTIGNWEDEEIVQGMLEPVGNAVPYTDYGNIPLASYNMAYERRSVIRFEHGARVGRLEEARAARINVSTAAEKRAAAALMLEVQRNRIAFIGYNAGNNRTYGFLNDPSLSAYVTAIPGVGGSTWATKTMIEITRDIMYMAGLLQTRSQGNIDPIKDATTLVLSNNNMQYLATPNEWGTMSVRDWITKTYPRMRLESAPELDGANGGANIAVLMADRIEDGSTDGGDVWTQIVPTKFMALGVEQQAKAYVEDFTNATAGAMLKRPYAVVRMTGV